MNITSNDLLREYAKFQEHKLNEHMNDYINFLRNMYSKLDTNFKFELHHEGYNKFDKFIRDYLSKDDCLEFKKLIGAYQELMNKKV